jgi:hypothetical protein
MDNMTIWKVSLRGFWLSPASHHSIIAQFSDLSHWSGTMGESAVTALRRSILLHPKKRYEVTSFYSQSEPVAILAFLWETLLSL